MNGAIVMSIINIFVRSADTSQPYVCLQELVQFYSRVPAASRPITLNSPPMMVRSSPYPFDKCLVIHPFLCAVNTAPTSFVRHLNAFLYVSVMFPAAL